VASIRKKQQSKYWFACFTRADGTRAYRSTKETDRKKAQSLADAFEQAARGRITAQQAQRIIADIFERNSGRALPVTSIRAYFESWLARKRLETLRSTHIFYTGKARRFIQWLGQGADRELLTVTAADVLAFRSNEAERVHPSTVNHGIKVLRMIFQDAKRDGVIADNPAEGVKLVKRNGSRGRRPFSLLEIRQLLAIADEEWRSLILFGLYTGQRLGDLARLTWANLDLQRNELRLCTSKTGRQQIIPLAPPLQQHVENLYAGDDPRQPLHLRAFASVEKSGKVGTLSRQFYELMVDAGMARAKKHRASENSTGRCGRREISEISFHSLRHTATSLMKNAGVPPAIVQDIIGMTAKQFQRTTRTLTRLQNEGLSKSCLTFWKASRDFALHAPWYGQLVERLVRNESGRSALTLSQSRGSALPEVELVYGVYLTLSHTCLKKSKGVKSGVKKRPVVPIA
jgi:integrase